MGTQDAQDTQRVLFLLEGRPVYKGDRLHVAPHYHRKAGAQVFAYREAIDGVATCRSTPSGAVPSVPITALSWNPFQETLDREAIQKQLPYSRISDRDVQMWQLGRDVEARRAAQARLPMESGDPGEIHQLIDNAP